ncbi:fructosamine kinase family protein [Nocardioides donggukensis]|uniref:Fructosamine kinase family protein n=1 Tax=Nocardioides donggukensis TaxID=2774019 RepID=A0A927K5L8_9ACTN|nr:fructosamine kinase family protein [Nocardioides donggukensis]MBD8868150.1 fructosamine kinase family protein [Nocardioides donggukensis]
MTRQSATARRAEELLGVPVVATAPVAGGDICTATRVKLSDGRSALVKTLAQPPDGFFAAEARGLRRLADVGGPAGLAVPEVLAVADDCLVLPWIEPGKPTAETAAAFGRALAGTHGAGAAAYGAERDGFIGRLPLPNAPADTWAEFYATRRVLPYLHLARDRGAVSEPEVTAVESVVGRLAELVPEEGPAPLHGDLWNGNVIWGADGAAHVVDPAAHAGHRETDLAMLALFGLPHLQRVVESYAESAPLADGWEDRQGLHQLHPLLVHACLFGGGYGARAAAVASHF